MIMGLGLIFYGMGVMGDAMTPLRSYEPFLDLMVKMENPLLGILVGAVFTGLVQSSAGLVLGKPVGVVLACWLTMRFAKVDLKGVTMAQLLGVGCLAGIGFTMSIFISELAFGNEALIDQAKVGILAASFIAGVLGAVVLSYVLPKGESTAS